MPTLHEIPNTAFLMFAYGWQGGTIHQLAKETGCTANELLQDCAQHIVRNDSNKHPALDLYGFSAARTCSMVWCREKLFPKHEADLHFWMSFINALRDSLLPGMQSLNSEKLSLYLQDRWNLI